jgi:threonyl-tRNA synthetase
MWQEQFFYFLLKYEFNFVDALGKASALTTDQIDVENAKRYGITYIDQDNMKKSPYILHCSPSGAIERVLYGLLEKAFIDEKEKQLPPTLPLWLSPTQIRFCPINDKLLPFCQKLAKDLEKENIRVDIDDRNETIGKKVREAEMEWVPLIVVVGEKEKKSKKFPVRFKAFGKIKQLNLKQIVKEVSKETKDKPFRPLPLPLLLSKRPSF